MVEERLQTQAQDLVGMATGFARTDDRVFVQNTVTAAVHHAKGNDAGHALCGWRYAGARKRGRGLPYRIVQSLVGVPSMMICERCMPTERALARSVEPAELSGGKLDLE